MVRHFRGQCRCTLAGRAAIDEIRVHGLDIVDAEVENRVCPDGACALRRRQHEPDIAALQKREPRRRREQEIETENHD